MTGRNGQRFLLPATGEVGIIIYDDRLLAIGYALILTEDKGCSYMRRVAEDDLTRIPYKYQHKKSKETPFYYTRGEFYYHTSTIFNMLQKEIENWANTETLDLIADVFLELRTELPDIMNQKKNHYHYVKNLKNKFKDCKKKKKEIAYSFIDLLYEKLRMDADVRREAFYYV